MSKKRIVFWILGVSIASNILFFVLWQHSLITANNTENLEQQYPFIGRRVFSTHNNIIVNFLPLREKLHKLIEPYKDTFALYFEYIPTGTSIGINEDSEFTAESLLKVPVVMAYFHEKERLGITTDPTVKIQANELNNKYGDLYKKGAGYRINLGDAVELALTKSDNTASLILADHISAADFQFVYEGLDVPMTLRGKTPIITAVQYASILKALYFASVLNLDDSQKILQLLTKTRFTSMLPFGIPRNIPVAHKIGLVNNQIYQDCGIVYLPQRNYLLCMVSQSDEKTARQRMSSISKSVYETVSTLNR